MIEHLMTREEEIESYFQEFLARVEVARSVKCVFKNYYRS